MTFDIRPLLTIDYWMTLQPPAGVTDSAGRAVFAGFVILFGLGIVIRIVNARRTNDKAVSDAIRHVAWMCVVMGLLGAMFYFFSFQQVPFFGAPFWYLLWLLGVLAWIGWIVYFVKTLVPNRRDAVREKQAQDKYLPNTKRRR